MGRCRAPLDDRQIGVAQSGRTHRQQNLAGPGRIEVHLVDRERPRHGVRSRHAHCVEDAARVRILASPSARFLPRAWSMAHCRELGAYVGSMLIVTRRLRHGTPSSWLTLGGHGKRTLRDLDATS